MPQRVLTVTIITEPCETDALRDIAAHVVDRVVATWTTRPVGDEPDSPVVVSVAAFGDGLLAEGDPCLAHWEEPTA